MVVEQESRRIASEKYILIPDASMIAQIDFIEGVVAVSNGESENKQVGMILLGSVLQVR